MAQSADPQNEVHVSLVDTRTDVERLRAEMAEQSAALESAPAGLVLAWAAERFGDDLAISCSFQDAVLIDIATAVVPGIEVVFLDTGSHFPETLEYVETVRARYDLNLTVTHPVAGAEDWPCGSAQCCEFRKVRPLKEALAGKEAWVTGLKRVDAPTRRDTPIVSYEDSWEMVKINPLAAWTDADIAGYAADHDLPEHPLVAQGYLSIGCAPTTRPVRLGEDPRAGRWSGSDKVECGLHV
ncbi:MAG: phosphoadenylyl-sulfate reductase [Acidimicrobiales bacterium]|nr:phosphoadenylyl-sulfate reductase [Acidimicrobiales bacterium]